MNRRMREKRKEKDNVHIHIFCFDDYGFGKLLKLSVKAAWGITHVVLTLVILPIVLVMLVIGGLIYIALPILVIVGVIALIKGI